MRALFVMFFLILFANFCKAQTNTLTDLRDGKTYKTVQIGSQVWMAENLSIKAIEFSHFGFNKYDTFDTKKGILYTWKIAEIACPR
jgi:uncharacterized protein (TIGR02145 family)